jgi:hypothetical protein
MYTQFVSVFEKKKRSCSAIGSINNRLANAPAVLAYWQYSHLQQVMIRLKAHLKLKEVYKRARFFLGSRAGACV